MAGEFPLESVRKRVNEFLGIARRQCATDTIRVEHIEGVPFRGARTLVVKDLCRNEVGKNESIILFKGVD